MLGSELLCSNEMLSARLRAWNLTSTPYPRNSTIAQIFEEVAARHHNSIAVVFGKEQISYANLNSRSNQLAHQLRRLGVGPETMVGCCLHRSIDLIVSLLAILKAGAAYIPLDPSYPYERLRLLLAETTPRVILTKRSLVASLHSSGTKPHFLFVDDRSVAFSTTNLEPAGGPTSLAYVMHTSGSTGPPKGVMVEQRAIVRLVRNTNFCNFGENEIFLQFAPITFDASTFEIWGALLNGARLVVVPPRMCSLQELGQIIREQGVTTLWLTAGLFNVMVEERLQDLCSVRQLLAGGDVLSPWHVRQVLERLPNCTLVNGYGPTENTTFTCCHVMHHGDHVPETVPIGRPISNSRVYILDQDRRPVPVGAAGELYAAGDGVARGYLNNPSATAEKFLPDPFVPHGASRMYRTGDLARWRTAGVVEFLGRIDNQVKILGYRVEPEEIEVALSMHDDLRQVCVVAHIDKHESKRLVAYYTTFDKADVLPSKLRDFLSTKLPHYMIPAHFVHVDAMPLSANGKLDRAALLLTPLKSFPKSPTHLPLTQFEATIAALWQRVLRADHVGLDDNFFDLGGNSLLLVHIHSNLQNLLQRDIPIAHLFEFATVRTLAQHLAGHDSTQADFGVLQDQARKQREAFARQRERRR